MVFLVSVYFIGRRKKDRHHPRKRMIQYSAPPVCYREGPGVLDAPAFAVT